MTVTLAPPTVAPVTSFTVPTNVAPPPVWAIAAAAVSIRVRIPRSAGRDLDARRGNRAILCSVTMVPPSLRCSNDRKLEVYIRLRWKARAPHHGDTRGQSKGADGAVAGREPAPQSSVAATKCGADALVRAGPPGPAFPASEQADQGVGRGPGGPPHQNHRGAKRNQDLVVQGKQVTYEPNPNG